MGAGIANVTHQVGGGPGLAARPAGATFMDSAPACRGGLARDRPRSATPRDLGSHRTPGPADAALRRIVPRSTIRGPLTRPVLGTGRLGDLAVAVCGLEHLPVACASGWGSLGSSAGHGGLGQSGAAPGGTPAPGVMSRLPF